MATVPSGDCNRLIWRQAMDPTVPARAKVPSSGRLVALYLLDLDGFKPVNDLHGHDAGDELLVQFAARLRICTRNQDEVVRLGSDEFVVVVKGLATTDDAVQVGDKLMRLCDEPFALAVATVRISLTVGYAIAPLDSRDASSLLKQADKAMYTAKQAGRQGLLRRHADVATGNSAIGS